MQTDRREISFRSSWMYIHIHRRENKTRTRILRSGQSTWLFDISGSLDWKAPWKMFLSAIKLWLHHHLRGQCFTLDKCIFSHNTSYGVSFRLPTLHVDCIHYFKLCSFIPKLWSHEIKVNEMSGWFLSVWVAKVNFYYDWMDDGCSWLCVP